MAMIMFALSVTIYEIFANKVKCKKIDLENEGQRQEGENETCAIQLQMFK